MLQKLAVARRVGISQVRDNDGRRLRVAFRRRGLEPFDDTPIPRRLRFSSRDPVGNLIEFTRIEEDYLK